MDGRPKSRRETRSLGKGTAAVYGGRAVGAEVRAGIIPALQAEEKPDPSRWWIVMKIIQLAFDIGELELDCMWNTVILPPKGGCEY